MLQEEVASGEPGELRGEAGLDKRMNRYNGIDFENE